MRRDRHDGAKRLLDILHAHGIRLVAGVPGGNILPLYDALPGSGLRHVLARHEQGAAFIAQGIARSGGGLGVCLATSGPGASNLLTGLADAWRDSIPVLAITGQVPRAAIGTQAFQELDIAAMAAPCTKAVFRVGSAAELDRLAPLAIATALSGRPGPVLLDIPKDVLLEDASAGPAPAPSPPSRPAPHEGPALEKALRLLGASRRPLAYAGGGIRTARAAAELRRFCRERGIPGVSTLLGLGAFAPDDPLFLGMPGMHGTPAANRALDECDLLLVAGARLDDRATGRLSSFAPGARILHLDADPSEFGRRRHADAALAGSAAAGLRALRELDRSEPRPGWIARITELKRRMALPEQEPHALLRALRATLPPDALAATDVGQHQMWAAQAWLVRSPGRFLTSGGLGTMGFGLPAALGAALARPGRTVACLSGDGSILMNIQELATLAELDLPVKICVLDNGGLGLVRQQQDLLYGGRRSACGFVRRTDLAAVARGFGIPALEVRDWRADGSWRRILSQPGPALAVFRVPEGESAWPMVPPGAANADALLPPEAAPLNALRPAFA